MNYPITASSLEEFNQVIGVVNRFPDSIKSEVISAEFSRTVGIQIELAKGNKDNRHLPSNPLSVEYIYCDNGVRIKAGYSGFCISFMFTGDTHITVYTNVSLNGKSKE